ncbi:hypothetical protein Cni_G06924 [Canna indica]|uniref:Reverse transcriptase zinc-binding domain-containing protein n=1 Tax=Canna indica TaxID=4628 RepID=A0AAQ3Q721_9LILI|nr:hypothetical protein Cni_G06924 [Canna indica]
MDEDNANHIFFDCAYAKLYKEKIEKEFSIKLNIKDDWFNGSWLQGKVSNNVKFNNWSKEVIAVSLWQLWKNRNSCYFNGKKMGLNTLFCRVMADILWTSINKADEKRK